MCSIFDTDDIALKRTNPNVVWGVKHKVCSILDTVTLHLQIIVGRGEYKASLRRGVLVNTGCLTLVFN